MPDFMRMLEEPRGMKRALIVTPAAEAVIYLQGAHLTQWVPRGQRPVLFTSAHSNFQLGKAIRGGVPVIFPWFGPRAGGRPGAMHGFARISEWTLESGEMRQDGAFEVMLRLGTSVATQALGYDHFELRFRAAIGERLEMELETRNIGPAPLEYEEALHTYFAVGDVTQVSVFGLENTEYIDKVDNFARKRQAAAPLRISGETDRVFVNTEAACNIEDAACGRRIAIQKVGSRTTVVWNPWIEKTRGLADMGADEWRGMICVETANAGENAICLEPGESRRMSATLSVTAL